jgi:iron(III) transport system substrate-binding protein
MKIPAWIILSLVATSLLLNSCASEISVTATPMPSFEAPVPIKTQLSNAPTEIPSALEQYMIPVYYAESYLSIVDGSKSEKTLTIYANLNEYNWNSLVRTFNTHYPWLRVTVLEMGPAEVFAQYDNDLAEDKPTADLIITSDPVGWLQFFENRYVTRYTSQEDLYIPDLSKSVYGTYAVSSEPMLIIYNKKLVPEPPNSMAALAEFIKNDTEGYKGQIVTYDAEINATGFAINWFWTDKNSTSGWDLLNAIGEAQPVFLASGREITQTVGRGGAKIGYFVCSGDVMPYLNTYPDLGWTYLVDGQPVLLNSMAITERAASPNAARLMMDFILSQEGQYALGLGGLTPFQSDIVGITDYHLDKIFTELGDDNVVLFAYDPRLNNQAIMNDFLEKWKAAVHK